MAQLPDSSSSFLRIVEADGTSRFRICYQPLPGKGPESQSDPQYQAALILNEYLYKVTGVTSKPETNADTNPVPGLPLQTAPQMEKEFPAYNIFLGNSTWLDSYFHLNLSQFESEQYTISVFANNIVMAGVDQAGDPWNFDAARYDRYTWPTTPTLHAVSLFLESYLGVRWFWPSWTREDFEELSAEQKPVMEKFGENYLDLKGQSLDIPTTPINGKPTFSFRNFHLPCMPADFSRLGFSYAGGNSDDTTGSSFANRLARRYSRWMRMNRLGAFDRLWVAHYMGNLMPKSPYYLGKNDKGEDQWKSVAVDPGHPEVSAGTYFAMHPNGAGVPTRGGGEPIPPRDKLMDNHICVTGPEGSISSWEPGQLSELLMQQMLPGIKSMNLYADYGSLHAASLAFNDGMLTHCQCDACQTLDRVKNGSYDLCLLSEPTPDSSLSSLYSQGLINLGDRYFTFFNQLATKAATEIGRTLPSPQKVWMTTFAYQNYVLPYGVQHPEIKPRCLPLADNLVIFDTHNGYAFRFHDVFGSTVATNARLEQDYRMQAWGATGGRLIVWSEPYFHGLDFMPVFSAVPLASNATTANPTEPFVHMLATMRLNKYSGVYFRHTPASAGRQNYGAHWPELFLIAQLLWNDGYNGAAIPPAEVGTYPAHMNERAASLRHEYYVGLFGAGAADVQRLDELASDAVANLISSATKSMSFYDSIKYWTFRTFYYELARIDWQHQVSRAATAISANGSNRELAHLQVVENNWKLIDLTKKMLESLDQYVTSLLPGDTQPEDVEDRLFYPRKWLRDCATVAAHLNNRLKLIRQVNDEKITPDFCSLVLPPTLIRDEDNISLKAGPTDKLLSLGRVRNILSTTLTIQNNVPRVVADEIMGPHVWPTGLAPHYNLRGEPISDTAGAVRLPNCCQNLLWTGDVWIDWFSRSNNIVYLVVVNSYVNSVPVALNILNLDSQNLGPHTPPRTLRYLSRDTCPGHRPSYERGQIEDSEPIPQTQWEHFSFDSDTNNPDGESGLVKDSASFDAVPGISVLEFRNANFAPYASSVNTWKNGNGTYTFQIDDVLDDDWTGRTLARIRFYIKKTSSTITHEVEGAWRCDKPDSSIYWNNAVTLPDNPKPGDHYQISAAVYDTTLHDNPPSGIDSEAPCNDDGVTQIIGHPVGLKRKVRNEKTKEPLVVDLVV